jgi:hypothetical protein
VWKDWFTSAAAAVLSRCPDDGVAIFFQTDIKVGMWIAGGCCLLTPYMTNMWWRGGACNSSNTGAVAMP